MALMAILGLGLLCGLYGYYGFAAIIFDAFGVSLLQILICWGLFLYPTFLYLAL